jgi:hypothetical protein
MYSSEMMVLTFVAGVMVGIVMKWLCAVASAAGAKQIAEEREKNDPANWWKYGGDPYGKSMYDDPDEERR